MRRTLPMLTVCCVGLLSASALQAGPSAPPVPLLVGGAAHGSEFIDALADLGVGNFVWVPKWCDPTSPAPWDDKHTILDDADACVRRGMSFMISQRRGLGRAWKLGGNEYGGDTETELHSAATVREISRRAGPLFAGLQAEEMDADLLQSAFRVSARTRIPEIYRFTDRAGGRRSFEGELARIARIYHGYGPGVRYCPNLCVSLHHSGFRAGGDIVMAELLEALPNTEMQLAYLRGGARQFGKEWGVWVSPWYRGRVPGEDKGLWKGDYAQPTGAHTASSLRRCLYLSYGSGARVLTVQQTEPLLARKPGGGYQLASWGRELKGFWDYARQHPEPLRPMVPLALLVDKDNGWAPGHLHGDWLDHQTIWGKLPAERSDTMLAAFLDVLLPGFERAEPDWWKEEGRFYPGYFSATPAGAFDIVSSDIQTSRLAQYPAVVLMADVDMTPRLLNTLRAYVKGGGALYINACQMRHKEDFVQDPEFLGATIGMASYFDKVPQTLMSTRRNWTPNRIVRRLPVAGVTEGEMLGPWYVAQDVQPTTAEVVADDGAGHPVLLRHRFGRGTVYLSTPEYMMEGFNGIKSPLSFFAGLVRGLASSGQVTVTGSGTDRPAEGVSWVAARQGNDTVITLANHGKAPRAIDVATSGGGAEASLDVGSGTVAVRQAPPKAIYSITVGPEDVAVVRIRKARPRST